MRSNKTSEKPKKKKFQGILNISPRRRSDPKRGDLKPQDPFHERENRSGSRKKKENVNWRECAQSPTLFAGRDKSEGKSFSVKSQRSLFYSRRLGRVSEPLRSRGV